MTAHVTRHAVARYQERVADVPAAIAVEALRSRAVELADLFGAPCVRLGTGQRVILRDHAVITVLPAEARHPPRFCRKGVPA